jgi:hypothetical protein
VKREDDALNWYCYSDSDGKMMVYGNCLEKETNNNPGLTMKSSLGLNMRIVGEQ